MLKRTSKAQILEKLYLEILDDVSNNDGQSLSDNGSAIYCFENFEIKLKIEKVKQKLELIKDED